MNTCNNECLPIAGLEEFTSAAARSALGADSPAIREERIVSFQKISGTGALHLGALFLSKFYRRPAQQPIHVSNPTWANHHQRFSNVGLSLRYTYFSARMKGLDFEGTIGYVGNASNGSNILLHAYAHNPIGMDLSQEQWERIAEVIREHKHFPFLLFGIVEKGLEMCIAQFFAKNCGLYGQRGRLSHIMTSGPDAKETGRRIAFQLAILQRYDISSPPAYGSRIASLILNDEKLICAP